MAASALITGASGLIGTWTRKCWKNHDLDILAVGGKEVDLLIPGASTDLIRTTSPRVVIHLAWSASGDPQYRTSANNLRWLTSTLELHRACQDQGIALWLTGTIVDDQPEGNDAYTRAKAELRARLQREIDSGEIGWLRPHYVFDESYRRPSLVAHALEAREKGRPAELQNPLHRHDFVHAEDVGNAVTSCVSAGLTGIIDIGSGTLRSVGELVSALGAEWRTAEAARPSAPISHAGRAADTTRLRKIGWKPNRTEEFFAHG